MSKFTPVGKIEKDHAALRVDLDGGYPLGRLVIAAADVPKMLNGREVDLNFVQQRPGREPFIGFAGTARISRSGKAVNVRIEGQTYTSPIAQVRQVVAGTRTAALLSRPAPAPILDADRVQRERIDAGLIHAF